MNGLPLSQEEHEAARRYLARSIAAGLTKVTRSFPPARVIRKNWTYSMSPRAIKQRALRGVVIPADGRRA
jgi:hypothetical protein